MRKMHIEVLRSSDSSGPYWWVRLRSANSQTIFTSETYSTKRAAMRAAAVLTGLSGQQPLAVVHRTA